MTSIDERADFRSEHDLLGDRDVPADAYWGVHTLRAVENFPITGQPLSSNMYLVRGLAAVKLAAARTNHELGLLDAERAGAIEDACADVMNGKLSEQFVVDVIQGGAGTSSNMNANEVIANRALEILGHPKGDYARLHPNDHVNLSQSTNDVYPTAVKLGTIFAARELLEALTELEDAFAAKALEFRTVVKMGRTQLQDAVPMTLGQEFGTYAVTIGEDRLRLAEADLLIHEINLGATAIGTGLNAPAGYAEAACRHLAEITGLPLVTAVDLIEATQDVGAFVHLSGVLKRVAVKLSKICNDLRLLSSGPRAGLGEINLPAVQSGSSIMPGKINPVIPEVVSQVAYEVDRQRRHHHHGRRGRPAPAQRLRTDHRPQPPQEHLPPGSRLPHPHGPLRPGHHRQHRTPPPHRGTVNRPRHRPEPASGLRHGHGHRPGSPRHRQGRRGTRARTRAAHRRAAHRTPQPAAPGQPEQVAHPPNPEGPP